jgi:hypothetical protein
MTVRRCIAIHEAGHAVAHVVFGDTVEYVSIRRGKHFGGIAVPGVRSRPDKDQWDPFVPVNASPPGFRASVERQIVSGLAGEIAVALLYRPTGRNPTRAVEAEAETIARKALDELSPRVAELVVTNEQADAPMDTDETVAHDIARAFAGPEAGIFYLEWLRAEAREFVTRYQAAILRVADALERHAVLQGAQVAALVHPPNPTRST